MRRTHASLLLMGAALLPSAALAQTGAVSNVVGIFNIFVGLMLTAALLLYGVGVIMWGVRLGSWPSYRTTAIRVLEWAVAMLFVLVVLLAIVQFFQRHPTAATFVLSAIVLVIVLSAVVYAMAHSGEGEKEH